MYVDMPCFFYFFQLEELNRLLLLTMVNCNTDCCGCTDDIINKDQINLQEYSLTFRRGSQNLGFPTYNNKVYGGDNEDDSNVNGDKRMLMFLYRKNLHQKPFSLDACGFFNVGRPTVPAVS